CSPARSTVAELPAPVTLIRGMVARHPGAAEVPMPACRYCRNRALGRWRGRFLLLSAHPGPGRREATTWLLLSRRCYDVRATTTSSGHGRAAALLAVIRVRGAAGRQGNGFLAVIRIPAPWECRVGALLAVIR